MEPKTTNAKVIAIGIMVILALMLSAQNATYAAELGVAHRLETKGDQAEMRIANDGDHAVVVVAWVGDGVARYATKRLVPAHEEVRWQIEGLEDGPIITGIIVEDGAPF